MRCYDLLLRLREGLWLLCLACDSSPQTPERILSAYGEHGRNRPKGPLPALSIDAVGTWDLLNDPADLTRMVRHLCAEPRPEAKSEQSATLQVSG
jgi:hypothetical protein